ncbi:tol-pal system-associated acyl-CoA thioesterase [Novosphingobium marinum]|uniref:Acyl-CoA thioester hydrolase n=1 Tax=Novosphingobium marinum TaxID=1514948 RepID=A0A7Z0BW30_9SPHN|nr:YbgC/FadM family acyl-CoA thioesterase [Novosphingobium marinum]NYH95990.1 acyl-CoA thioester hydrolase [Novosphingobium marinum]GGC31598.1 tol-pal system-associated acyl-CoA thioesterase [Novosphingobium marinum]
MTILPEPTSGILQDRVHRYAVRVYFEDTDAGGIVYHANYLRWFERARTDLLRLLGIDQAEALASGEGNYAIAEVEMRYRAPARLGETVLIETRPEEIRAASCRLSQVALRGETLLCEARLRVGFVSPDGKPRRQPDEWRKAFATAFPENEGCQ